MTIKGGMREAFRRLGATEKEINDCLRLGPPPDIAEAPINAQQEEQFIEAYMNLVSHIAEGPGRQAAEEFLARRRANN